MIVERRIKTDGTVLVKLDSGEWLPEEQNICEACGFEAKSSAGLSAHECTHEEEE